MNTLTKAQEDKLKCEIQATVKVHGFEVGVSNRAYRTLGEGFTAHVYREVTVFRHAYVFGVSNEAGDIVLRRTVHDEPGKMVREIAKFCDDPMNYFHVLTKPKDEVD